MFNIATILSIWLILSTGILSGQKNIERPQSLEKETTLVEHKGTEKGKNALEPCKSCEDRLQKEPLEKIREDFIPRQDLSKYYPTSKDPNTICYAGYVFDPSTPPPFEKGLTTRFHKGKNYAVIQFTGPILKEWKNRLKKLNIKFYNYLPHYAFIVKGDESSLSKASEFDFICAVIPYHPALKLSPTIGKHVIVGADDRPYDGYRLIIELFDDADPRLVRSELKSLVRKIVDSTLVYHKRFIVDVDKGTEKKIAQIEEVKWIEEQGEYILYNYRHRQVTQSGAARDTILYSHGIHGNNQILAIMDSGIRTTHDLFSCPADKIISNQAYGSGSVGFCDGDCESHGTHVAGTAAGCYNNGTGLWSGVADQAKIVFQDIGNSNLTCTQGYVYPPSDLTQAYQDALNLGAYVHTNSWGGSSNEYNSYCVDIDDFMWNHQDFLILFAAGNDPYGASSGSIGYPATAKSVLGIGATGMPNTGNFNTRADYSCYGPVYDGRIGPILYNVAGVGNSSDDSTYTWSAGSGTDTQLCGMVGTSMATPGAAGAAILVRQYFVDGYYPTGTPTPSDAFTPSSALIKAVMVAGSDHLGNPANTEYGFGRINLDKALYFPGDAVKLKIFDCSTGLNTGDNSTYTVNIIDNAQDLTVVLAWNDYPAAVSANPAIVNNLDLEVISPSGSSYKGNYFSAGYSVSGGSYDNLNTIEMVYLQANNYETGNWQIVIHGQNVPQGPQPFAVVVTGGISSTSANLPPSTPVIVRPFHNAILKSQGGGITLRLYSSDPEKDNIYYTVEFANDRTLSGSQSYNSPVVASNDTVDITLPVSEDTIYWWRVKAVDTTGNSSNWTSLRAFTLSSSLSESPYWYQFTGQQFNECDLTNLQIQGDSVMLTSSGPGGADTFNIVVENWDDGDYIGWHAYDYNSDGATWAVGTTSDLSSYEPLNYGIYYVFYSDDDAGSSSSQTEEWLYYDPIYIDPDWDSLKIYYEYGFREYINEALGFYVFFHYAEGDTWSSSAAYRFYSSSSSGSELIDLSDTLYNGHNPGTGAVERPDSLQIAWIYFDNGEWGWAAAVDSVNLFAIDTSVGTITAGVLLTPPVSWYDLIKEDPLRTSWIGVKIQKGSAQDSIGIQIEYKAGNTWNLVPDADLGWANSSPHFDMSSDFNAVSIPFDGSVYDTLRLRLTFKSGTKSSPVPVLKEIGFGSVSSTPTGIRNVNKPYRFSLTLKQTIFRDNLAIEYEIPQETKVNLKVYDISGRIVAEVFSGKKKPGIYSAQWRGTTKTGGTISPGIYFLRFEAGKKELIRKVIKVK